LDEAAFSSRQLLEALPNAVAIIDLNGEIIELNSRLTAMTDFTRADLLGQNVQFLVPPWNAHEHLRVVRSFTADPSLWQTWSDEDLYVARKNGSELSVSFALSHVTLNDRPLVVVAIRDNSEQKEAESARADAEVQASLLKAATELALAESEQRFRLAFANNMTPMVFSDLDGRILAANKAFCKMVGRDLGELVGHTSDVFTAPNDRGVTEDVYRRMNAKERDDYCYVKRLTHQNGQIVDVEISIAPAKAESGETLYYVSSVRDISHQVRNERILTILAAVNKPAISATSEVEILQRLCDALVSEGEYALAWVGVKATSTEDDVTIFCAAGATEYLYDGIVTTSTTLPSGAGPTGTALHTGKVQVANDLATEEAYDPWRESAAQFGFRSAIAIPNRPDAPSGVLSVYSKDRFAFDHVVVKGLQEVVLEAKISIAHVRSVKKTEQALEETAAAMSTLKETEERFRLAFEDNMTPMVFSDLDDLAIAVNDAFCEMVGFSREELLGHDSRQFTFPDDVGITERSHELQMAKKENQLRYTKRYLRKDGRVVLSEVSRSAALDDAGNTLYFVSSERDITEQSALTAQLRHQAMHDPLTGLANRALFENRLIQANARVARQGGYGAVVLVDLDDFKGVNDTFGHLVGDQLLIGIARRLELVTRASDTLCRLGGDEFLYLAEGLSSPDEADDVAVRLIEMLAEPFVLNGIDLSQQASVGVVVFDGSSALHNESIQEADVALYEAKKAKRGRHVVFDPSMRQDAISRFSLVQELRQALLAGELTMHYQPIVELTSTKIVGFEALMRWNHAVQGWIPPNVFITLAEQSELILDLGAFALHEAVTAASTWAVPEGALQAPYVTVNFSAHQFHSSGLIAMIEGELLASGLAPERLVIEITETVALSDATETMNTLSHFRQIGVGSALDDFGTGFSSLSYLALLNPTIIKIDRTFVSPVHETPHNSTLLEAIISLGHKLNTTVLAEGIEQRHQLERLRHFGCQLGQGFLFSCAVPASEVPALLNKEPGIWLEENLLDSASSLHHQV
jgi:diguanylate cyclase (GGDEF)-like protein/PAS domain S-box-containing protein